MSLLLNSAKTLTLSGTDLQCVEIYTGEAYTMPIHFKTSTNLPLDCTGWTISASAKFYQGTITETTTTFKSTDLLKVSPQPSTGAGTYSASLSAAFTDAVNGVGYLYIPANLCNGTGSPNPTPAPDFTDTLTNLVIVTVTITRTDTQSGLSDINREPVGIVVRYQ